MAVLRKYGKLGKFLALIYRGAPIPNSEENQSVFQRCDGGLEVVHLVFKGALVDEKDRANYSSMESLLASGPVVSDGRGRGDACLAFGCLDSTSHTKAHLASLATELDL